MVRNENTVGKQAKGQKYVEKINRKKCKEIKTQ